VIFLVTGNSISFNQNVADEKNELNIDLENDLVTYINPEVTYIFYINNWWFILIDI
jgi:hypothetical protein